MKPRFIKERHQTLRVTRLPLRIPSSTPSAGFWIPQIGYETQQNNREFTCFSYWECMIEDNNYYIHKTNKKNQICPPCLIPFHSQQPYTHTHYTHYTNTRMQQNCTIILNESITLQKKQISTIWTCLFTDALIIFHLVKLFFKCLHFLGRFLAFSRWGTVLSLGTHVQWLRGKVLRSKDSTLESLIRLVGGNLVIALVFGDANFGLSCVSTIHHSVAGISLHN